MSTIPLQPQEQQSEVQLTSDMCQKEVKCYDYLKRYCLRPKGHTLGCNPFSDTYIDPRVKEK